jgi:CRP-like cAMP-binding protein
MPDAVGSRVFDGLNAEARQVWLAAAVTRELKRRETLARQGDPADFFCVVEHGRLKLLQITPEGDEIIVRFVGPGEPFGGVVALDHAAYPVTALAVESTRVWVWSTAVFRGLLDRFPSVRSNIMREMSAHMTDALTRVRELATERVGQRLAHALLRLLRQCGEPHPEGMLIGAVLTREELASLTGTTLFTVSRTLSEWQEAGILRMQGRRLLVLDPARLRALTQADET